MQDVLLKYGLLLVSLVLVIALGMFGFNALKAAEPTLEFEQEVTGDSVAVNAKVITLCGRCVQDPELSQECFILKITLTDEVYAPPQIVPGEFTLQPEGNWQDPSAFRIENQKGVCVVRGLG